MSVHLKDELVRELDGLSDGQIEELLKSARKMQHKLPPTISGRDFVRRFSGLIPEPDVLAMEKAIEEAFEQVEENGRQLPA